MIGRIRAAAEIPRKAPTMAKNDTPCLAGDCRDYGRWRKPGFIPHINTLLHVGAGAASEYLEKNSDQHLIQPNLEFAMYTIPFHPTPWYKPRPRRPSQEEI